MSPGELGRERGWSLRKVSSFHDCHRTTGRAPAATTRASDLCVTLKEGARLLLSVDGDEAYPGTESERLLKRAKRR
jgi:hypothetical protein